MSRSFIAMGVAALVAALAMSAAPPARAQCPDPDVNLRPNKGAPSKRLLIEGSGLAPGQPVYLHWWSRERGRYVKTKRVRRRAGACGEFEIRRRALKGLRTGLWRLQFDNAAAPSRSTSPQLWGEVSVQRRLVAPFPKLYIALRRGHVPLTW